MDENVIDTLRIEIVGDDSGAVSNIEKLVANLEKIKGVTSGANRGLTAIQKHLNSIATAADNINSGSIAKLHQIANGLNALAKVGSINISSKVAERITKLGTAVDSLKGVDMSKLHELAGGLKAIKDVGDVTIPNLRAITQATSAVSPVSAAPSAPSAPSGTTPVGVTEVTGELEDLGGALEETGSRFVTFKNIATGCLNSIKTRVTGVINSVRNFFKRFTMRIMYRFMNFIISTIVNSVKQGINNVYQYSKAFEGRFSKSMDTLATSFNYLTNSLGAMAAPIINLLTPYIDQLVDQFVVLLNVVNQVFARLSGANTWTKAIKVTTEYAAAADDATNANKKLKNSLLGIDEINALQDNSGSAKSAANMANNPAYAFQEMPLNTSEVDDIITKMKRILKVAGLIGSAIAAWDVARTIADITKLAGIKSIALTAGVVLTATGLTLIVEGAIDIITNGIDTDNLVQMLLGDSLTVGGGALIGTAFGGALIGGAIGAFVGGIASSVVGIWSAITEGINWLNGMLTTVGTTLVGAGIGAFFGPIGILIGGLVGMAIGLWTDLIIALVQGKDDMSHLFIEFGDIWWNGIDTIKGYIQKFIDWWWNGAATIDKWYKNGIDTIVGWWTDGCDTIKNNAEKLWNNITSNVNLLWVIVKSTVKLIVDKAKNGFDTVKNKASSCWNSIKTAWKSGAVWINDNFIKPVKTYFTNLWNTAKDKASSAWTGIKNTYTGVKSWFITTVITPVGNYFAGLWDGFRTKARTAWEGVKTVFSKAGTFFKDTFKKAWEGVVKVFSTGGRIFVDIKNGILSAFKKIVNDLIKGINNVVSVPFEGINTALKTLKDIKIGTLQPFADIREITVPKIPLLAEGGQVNAGQMFVAREAGAELVGNVGRKTTVMNNDQIVESVSQGVADANAEQNALLREEISILRRLLEKDTNVTAYISSGSLVGGLERKNRRDGRTIVPVGT